MEDFNEIDDLFGALEHEDVDSIRFCNEEISFWTKIARKEKDKAIKDLYAGNVDYFKAKIEDIYCGIIERREFKKEFSRI